jgi:hypothetical protein
MQSPGKNIEIFIHLFLITNPMKMIIGNQDFFNRKLYDGIKDSNVKIYSCGGGHLGFLIRAKITHFVLNHRSQNHSNH